MRSVLSLSVPVSVACLALGAAALLGTAACGSSPPPAPAPVAAPPPATATAGGLTPIVAPVVPEAPAHKLVVAANACWFGGLWADAERDVPEARRGVIEARCREVLKAVYGNDDKVRMEQLRVFEPQECAAVQFESIKHSLQVRPGLWVACSRGFGSQHCPHNVKPRDGQFRQDTQVPRYDLKSLNPSHQL